MKKYFILIVAALSIHSSYGQTQIDTTSNTFKNLKGVWYLQGSFSTQDNLLFSRKSQTHPHGWGNRIEIYSNSNFADAYSAKCGNDNAVHYTKGSWSFDTLTMIFTTSILVCRQDKEYRIIKSTADTLILKPLR